VGQSRERTATQATTSECINGASWPTTEVLNYRVGEQVRWRVVNLSSDTHAMHLHGMFFDVVSTSNGLTSQVLNRPLSEVTHAMPTGTTFDMNWQPEHAGNWLFHCHMTVHMMSEPPGHNMADHMDEPAGGMAGIIVGIHVTEHRLAKRPHQRQRRGGLTLRLREELNRYGAKPGYRIDRRRDSDCASIRRAGPGSDHRAATRRNRRSGPRQ
jgi:hypothetical protein